MIRTGLLLLTLCFYFSCLKGEESNLVYLSENGTLNYKRYANTGESDSIHKIPDFSHAGYKMGGVKLPEIPTVLTIQPVAGDNTQHIQNAINQVSLLPENINGFRGAILLKKGKYTCSGPIHIKTSGVILKGEAQDYAENGGTEIFTIASYQHNLIQLSGAVISKNSSETRLDTVIIPKRSEINGNVVDGKFWVRANVENGIKNVDSPQTISIKISTNINDYSSYHSKEGENKPFLMLKYLNKTTSLLDSIKILPSDDAYIKGGEYSANNFGSEFELAVKYAGDNNRVTRDAFLKFTIPFINGELQEASLNLWCHNAGNQNDMSHYIYSINNYNWNEDNITYLTQPLPIKKSYRVKDAKVGVGKSVVTIDNASDFSVGDNIVLKYTPNQKWIDDLDMAQYGWTYSEYNITYKRTISNIKGDSVFINVPIFQCIDKLYGGAEISLDTETGFLENVGIQNMLLSSNYLNDEDELHGWNAVELKNAKNCWVRKVTAVHFGYACVNLNNTYQCTVEDCAMLDPKSQTTGGRKYSFNINKGSFNLFQRCYTRGGRHDFVLGARVPGPNVFLDCLSQNSFNDIGPHHRYATGSLFDNISGKIIRVQNRKDSGTGHGWAGAQTMFWNLRSIDGSIKVEGPKGAINWAIGCWTKDKFGSGFWELRNKNLRIRSLYLQQLKDRLGENAVVNISTLEQRNGNIYPNLEIWSGLASNKAFTHKPYSDLKIPGTIEAEFFNVGLPGAAYQDKSKGNVGHSVRNGNVDVYTDFGRINTTPQLISFIGNVENGEWLEYSLDAEKGNYTLDLQYASAVESKLILYLNNALIDTVSLTSTPSKIDFSTHNNISFKITEQGKQKIRIEFTDSNIRLDKFTINVAASASKLPHTNLLTVFPNPTVGRVLHISSHKPILKAIAYGLDGKLLKMETLSSDKQHTIRFSKGVQGSLFIKVIFTDHSSKITKAVLL